MILYLVIIYLIIKLIFKFLKKKIKYPDVKFPFINIKDENDKNLNILGVKGYLDTDENVNKFIEYLNSGMKFIGVSSYLSFPQLCGNAHGYCHNKEYKINNKYIEEYVLGWCHCFRNPDNYIKFNIPKILISESDFNADNLEYNQNSIIKYDYITLQPVDNNECSLAWHGHNKNWPLAEKCIQIFADEFNLKGLIVGREKCPVRVKNKNNVETTGFLQYYDLNDKIKSSRFMLLPNFEDASPRVLTEALSMNKPIFVNENILGGWKYVNDKTGEFFNENNIREKLKILLDNYDKYEPRTYFLNNHGLKNTGKELAKFLKKIHPELNDCTYAKFPVN